MSMMKKITTWFIAVFAAATLMTAWAADPVIEQAKAQGIIGEQFDGYLGIADAGRATPDIKRHVDEVNSGRLAEYTRIAAKTGDPVQTVAAAMAEKQFARAESGEVLKPGAGQGWAKKP